MISQTKEDSEAHTYRGPCNRQFHVCNPLEMLQLLFPSVIIIDYLVLTEKIHLFTEKLKSYHWLPLYIEKE